MLALIIIVVIMIIFNERFVAAFDMVLKHSRNPIDTYWNGRYDKDSEGRDWYDRTFQKHVLTQNLSDEKKPAIFNPDL